MSERAEVKTVEGQEVHFSEGLARDLTHFCSENKLPFIFSHQFPCTARDIANIAVFCSKPRHKLLGLNEVKKAPVKNAKF